MKKILFAAFPAILLFSGLFIPADPLPIGAALPHPEVKMKDISGKEVSFSDARKKNGLLVMFSCNTCPYVIKNQSRTKEACQFASANDIGVVLLNANEAQRSGDDSYEEMKAYAAEQGYNWYYLIDKNSAMADAFGANRTPECFLFDKEGKLVYHGAIDDNASDASAVSRKHLIAAMTEMKADMEVSVKKSRSVGCTIKRQ
jgi:peroxiredoxin